MKAFVGLEDAMYAGSHGFDINGTLVGKHFSHDVAAAFRPALVAAKEKIEAELAGVAGATVEDNRYSISVHYRNVAEVDQPRVEAVVDSTLSQEVLRDQLVKRLGKCVYEIRPNMAWHKGAAVAWLTTEVKKSLGSDASPLSALVVGDDMTDEDMFAAASDARDFTPFCILVATPDHEAGEPDVDGKYLMPRPTHARYFLRSPQEFQRFLDVVLAEAPASHGVPASAS